MTEATHAPEQSDSGTDAAARAMPDAADDEFIARQEERLAEQRTNAIEAGRRAEVAAEEGEERVEIVAVSLDRVGRHPPFIGQPSTPTIDGRGECRGDGRLGNGRLGDGRGLGRGSAQV